MKKDILEYTSIFQEITELLCNHIYMVTKVLPDQELQSIFSKYNQHKEEHKNSEFNIFNLLSDKYYYENLHSDIISTFLDRTGKHNEGNKFLAILLELLKKIKPELDINSEDFKNTSINREKYHIDILIQDESTKRVIIIETKLTMHQIHTDNYQPMLII